MLPEKVVARAKKALEKIPWPDGIHGMSIQLGEDWAGDPAIWIYFVVDDELKPSKARVDELSELASAVNLAIRRSDIGRFPYVDFRTRDQSLTRNSGSSVKPVRADGRGA